MSVIINGDTGITTPGVTDTGTLSVTGVTTLTGGLNAALPVLSGGTGVTTSTGTGAGVHATSPTITGLTFTSASTAVPVFSYYQSVAQTLSANTITKLTFTTSNYDTTSGMYASSRFTPTIAGYYLISTAIGIASTATGVRMILYKNGSEYQHLMSTQSATINGGNGTTLVFLNGSTDYVEIYGSVVIAQNTYAFSSYSYFQGCMVRSA